MRIEELTVSEWEDALPNDGYEIFHTAEVLKTIDKYVDGELRLLGGFKGREPIGLFPVNIRRKSFARATISPPPGLSIDRMGPILLTRSPKRSKREKVNRAFTENVLDSLRTDEHFTIFRTVSGTAYDDPRPYIWAGFDVEMEFFYIVDLDSRMPDDVLNSFSASTRKEIRIGENLDVIVRTGGTAELRAIYDAYIARYREQNIDYSMSWEYTRDLVDILGDRARSYVVETTDGEFLGGNVILYSNDKAQAWIGGTRGSVTTSEEFGYQDVSVNNLIHWTIMKDILTDPTLSAVNRYDLGTAGSRRLSRYKSKFNPDLVPHYKIKSGRLVDIAMKAYQLMAT